MSRLSLFNSPLLLGFDHFERVIDRVDHTNLNEDVDFLKDVIPTAENLARAFWAQLANSIPSGELYEVVLEETERNSVRYRGEDE